MSCIHCSNVSDYIRLSEEYNAKLKKLKDSLLAAIKTDSSTSEAGNKGGGNDDAGDDAGDDACDGGDNDGSSGSGSGEQPARKKRKAVHLAVGVGFEEYCSLMRSVGLENLATQSVFRIFDVDGDGSIDVKEFLLALIALRSRHSNAEEEEAAQLYFSVFDMNEDGHICRDEMVSTYILSSCSRNSGASCTYMYVSRAACLMYVI